MADIAREPSLLFDGAQPDQTYTALILDLPVVFFSTEPPSVVLASSTAYLSFFQTFLRPVDGSRVLSSNHEPLVPYGTPDITSAEPHLVVTLLFGSRWNYTLSRQLQQDIREIGQCEDSRSKFDFIDFLGHAGLVNPVAANWFIVAGNVEQENADVVTTVIPTLTRTVTASTSSSTFPANSNTKTAGQNHNAPPTLVVPITVGKTAGVPSSEEIATGGSTSDFVSATLESSEQLATPTTVQLSEGTDTGSLSSADDNFVSVVFSSLSTLTVNPTAALGAGSGAATGTGGLVPTSTAAVGLTAGGVRDAEPALVGALAALMVTAGFYWMFM